MSFDKTVSISKKRYDVLLEQSLLLRCLQSCGVNDWEWYGEAMKEYEAIQQSKEISDEASVQDENVQRQD